MKKNKRIIIIIIILVMIVAISGAVTYTIYKRNKVITEFNNYIEEYIDDISMYILDVNKTKYQELINECDHIIVSKESEKVEGLKEELSQLKDDLTNSNIDLINKSISELEAIDTSKLDEKDSIVNKIKNIKKLRDEKEYINANEEAKTIKTEINEKLEIIRQEEEAKAKAEAEAEAKAKAEEEEAKAEAEAKVKADVANQGGTKGTNQIPTTIKPPTVTISPLELFMDECYSD